MSINRVTLSGNLTRDPELKSTQGGTAVLSFGIAVNDRRKNPTTGEWEEYPNYVDAVLFGTRANAIYAYLSKGSKVAIEGKLRYSSWEREGERRSKLEVIIDEIEFLSPRNDQQQAAPQQAPTFSAPPQQAAPQQAPQYVQPQQFQQMAQQLTGQQTFYPNQAPLPQQQYVPEVAQEDISF